MRNINENINTDYDLINSNAVLISKIHQSFEALEEALGMLKLEEPLFLTYIAKNSTEEYKIN